MKQAYLIPAEPLELCYEIKKSQFITRIAKAADRAEAMAVLAQAKQDYPDARHHCWAYLLGDPKQPVSVAFNDDGEPSGTAGKPIVNVLNHRGIGDIAVVVIRYFGGIKLGAGGLVRAYSTATQQAIEALSTVIKLPMVERRLSCDYAVEPELRRLIKSLAGQIVEADYGLQLDLLLHLPLTAELELEAFCAGRATLKLQPSEALEKVSPGGT